VDGIPTNYTLDLNAGLTQVLDDGTYSYTYGLGRISQQQGTTPEYFLSDALGSVRQMTDQSGAVTFAQTYDPYGVVTQAGGTSQSAYGFTGEMTDSYTNLVYFRARFYNPLDGRFQSRDSWGGDVNQPMSFNRWMYTSGNPINLTDPTGHIKEGQEAYKADSIRIRLGTYGVQIVKDWGYRLTRNPISSPPKILSESAYTCEWDEGNWKIKDLELIEIATDDLKHALHGPNKIRAAVGQFSVRRDLKGGQSGMMTYAGPMRYLMGTDIAILSESTNEAWYKHSFVHEFGHVWDIRMGSRLSLNLMKKLGTWICTDEEHNNPLKGPNCWFPELRRYDSDNEQVIIPEAPPDTLRICLANPNSPKCENPPYSSTYGKNGSLGALPAGAEDWANSLAYFVYPGYRQSEVIGLGKVRRQYVKQQIANLP
jgi:RHS repeat-associated protein